MRGAIYYLGKELEKEDSEAFYQEVGKKIIANMPQVYDLIKNL